MALDTYSDLKATVIRFAGRDDLSDIVDDCIALAEDQFYSNEIKPLRLRGLEISTTLQTIAGTNAVALPTGYLSGRTLAISSGGAESEMVYNSPSALPKRAGSGCPVLFTIEGDNLVFDITPDAVYDLAFAYFGKPTALSSANPTNFVLTNHPTIYLWGCLSNVYEFTSEPDDASYQFNKMIGAIKGAIKNDKDGRSINAQERKRGSTP